MTTNRNLTVSAAYVRAGIQEANDAAQDAYNDGASAAGAQEAWTETLLRHFGITVDWRPTDAAPVVGGACGCPTNEIGDIRCHVCGERVNVRCWKCHTPRGEGPCPNPIRAADEGR